MGEQSWSVLLICMQQTYHSAGQGRSQAFQQPCKTENTINAKTLVIEWYFHISAKE